MIDAATASSLASAQLGSKIDFAVARKTLESQSQQGAAAIALLEDAVEFARETTSRGAVSARQGFGETGGALDVRG